VGGKALDMGRFRVLRGRGGVEGGGGGERKERMVSAC
jgi:hypothetical protein